ncbi:hypothetical protein SAMN05444128_0440 [Pontibacter indicus]|uniref:Uncharacterized protein n=1 Tax=Pontibacter indicus TaxID=1317125 RepID=A0A1R3WGR3_9BACT|nr:hypothetical protein SAMN05444128_0440 [Pontibacter indicus]
MSFIKEEPAALVAGFFVFCLNQDSKIFRIKLFPMWQTFYQSKFAI